MESVQSFDLLDLAQQHQDSVLKKSCILRTEKGKTCNKFVVIPLHDLCDYVKSNNPGICLHEVGKGDNEQMCVGGDYDAKFQGKCDADKKMQIASMLHQIGLKAYQTLSSGSDPSHITVYESCGEEGELAIYSFHFVVKGDFSFRPNDVLRGILAACWELGVIDKMVHMTLSGNKSFAYDTNPLFRQQLRLLGSTKHEIQRPKKLCLKNNTPIAEDYVWSESDLFESLLFNHSDSVTPQHCLLLDDEEKDDFEEAVCMATVQLRESGITLELPSDEGSYKIKNVIFLRKGAASPKRPKFEAIEDVENLPSCFQYLSSHISEAFLIAELIFEVYSRCFPPMKQILSRYYHASLCQDRDPFSLLSLQTTQGVPNSVHTIMLVCRQLRYCPAKCLHKTEEHESNAPVLFVCLKSQTFKMSCRADNHHTGGKFKETHPLTAQELVEFDRLLAKFKGRRSVSF